MLLDSSGCFYQKKGCENVKRYINYNILVCNRDIMPTSCLCKRSTTILMQRWREIFIRDIVALGMAESKDMS